jgi:hypothetical protein
MREYAVTARKSRQGWDWRLTKQDGPLLYLFSFLSLPESATSGQHLTL